MNKQRSIKEIKIETSYSDSTIRRFLKGLNETERRNHTSTKGNRIYIDMDFFLSKIESKRIKAGKEVNLNHNQNDKNLFNKLLQDQDQRIKELNEWIEKLIRSNEYKDQLLNEKDKDIKLLMNKILSNEERIKELSAPKTATGSDMDKTFVLLASGLILVLILILVYLILE